MACDCDDMQQSSHDTVTSRDLSWLVSWWRACR